MRIKTLVTSRMAPPKRDQRKKRASKEKTKEIEILVPQKQVFPAMGSYLKKSTVTEEDLRKLHEAGWMQDKVTLLWSAPLPSHNIPLVPVDHTLMFSLFIERGLGLPVCSFLRGILHHYGLELPNLNPNGVLNIAIFVHFCEAFLGIRPHFNLFRDLFHVKPIPKKNCCNPVGGAGFKLRQVAKHKYIEYDLKENNPGWKDQWWYVGNHAPKLPEFTGGAPIENEMWNGMLPVHEAIQLKELYSRIATLKEKGVTGASVAFSWLQRRVQPLAHKEKWGFEFTGRDDPSRLSKLNFSEKEIMRRIQSMFKDVYVVPVIPQLFDANHPPKQEDVDTYFSWPIMPEDIREGEIPKFKIPEHLRPQLPEESTESGTPSGSLSDTSAQPRETEKTGGSSGTATSTAGIVYNFPDPPRKRRLAVAKRKIPLTFPFTSEAEPSRLATEEERHDAANQPELEVEEEITIDPPPSGDVNISVPESTASPEAPVGQICQKQVPTETQLQGESGQGSVVDPSAAVPSSVPESSATVPPKKVTVVFCEPVLSMSTAKRKASNLPPRVDSKKARIVEPVKEPAAPTVEPAEVPAAELPSREVIQLDEDSENLAPETMGEPTAAAAEETVSVPGSSVNVLEETNEDLPKVPDETPAEEVQPISVREPKLKGPAPDLPQLEASILSAAGDQDLERREEPPIKTIGLQHLPSSSSQVASRSPRHAEESIPFVKSNVELQPELFEDPLLDEEYLTLIMERSRRAVEYMQETDKYLKEVTARSYEKSQMLHRTSSVIVEKESLKTELAELKKHSNKLQMLLDGAVAEKLNQAKAHAKEKEVLEAANKALEETNLNVETRNTCLWKRNRELTGELKSVQKDLDSWRNGCYRATEEKEQIIRAHDSLKETHATLQADYESVRKMLHDSDVEYKQNLMRIRDMGAELEKSKSTIKELEAAVVHQKANYSKLEEAALVVVESINPTPEGAQPQPLVERLQEAPGHFAAYCQRVCKFLVTQVLAVVQSFYPGADFKDVADGKASDCPEEKFKEYLEDFGPVADNVAAKLVFRKD